MATGKHYTQNSQPSPSPAVKSNNVCSTDRTVGNTSANDVAITENHNSKLPQVDGGKKIKNQFAKKQMIILFAGFACLALFAAMFVAMYNLTMSIDDKIGKLSSQIETHRKFISDKIGELSSQLDKPWKIVGTLRDYQQLLSKYPTDKYQWGMNYNTISITPLVIQKWNLGVRIFPEFSYSMGDDSNKLTCGRAIFVKDLQNPETKQGFFYHQYVDCNFVANGQTNHNSDDVIIFVRKL